MSIVNLLWEVWWLLEEFFFLKVIAKIDQISERRSYIGKNYIYNDVKTIVFFFYRKL